MKNYIVSVFNGAGDCGLKTSAGDSFESSSLDDAMSVYNAENAYLSAHGISIGMMDYNPTDEEINRHGRMVMLSVIDGDDIDVIELGECYFLR